MNSAQIHFKIQIYIPFFQNMPVTLVPQKFLYEFPFPHKFQYWYFLMLVTMTCFFIHWWMKKKYSKNIFIALPLLKMNDFFLHKWFKWNEFLFPLNLEHKKDIKFAIITFSEYFLLCVSQSHSHHIHSVNWKAQPAWNEIYERDVIWNEWGRRNK